MTFCPIAIVGRGCVLPGALTPTQLGTLSIRGADVIGEAPPGRWRIDDALILRRPEDSGPDTTWSCRGGYVDDPGSLEGIDRDALATAFGPLGLEDVEALDPVFRRLLHAGRDALADAGMRGGERVGAVVGNLSFPTQGMARHAEHVWLEALDRASGWPSGRPDPRARFMSGLPAHALARAFGLGAGAFAIDAACASSLVAIEIACAELATGRVDAMVAGAVNAADDLFLHMGFRALEALSPTGRSRPFHPDADGLVPAEGAALFVLERLDDAIAAGRVIHGVIRGVGLSNDGRGRGLLVPSSEGQQRALVEAYRSAGVDPARLGWVECHATGTVVGDGTEIASMAAVLAEGRSEPLPIGSLKANMGHLITAAGGAGLLRVLEAMRQGVLPPTPHADRTIEALNDTPFEVLTTSRPWPEGEHPRLAGVSAFGFGGNNAHLVVEQWRGDRKAFAASARTTDRPAPMAVVALGARVGERRGHRAFAEALLTGTSEIRAGAPGLSRPSAHAEQVRLPMTAMRFPPRDLEQTLPQQLLLMEVAGEALGRLAGPAPDGERSGVFVGMQCDTAVARHGARWRVAEWGRRWGAGEAWVDEARDRIAPLLGSAGVLGCMPNICANRLNSQLDWRGPSCTLSSEELSGLRALRLAQRMLVERTIDVALVAAVDVCAEPAHVAAAAALGIDEAPGDAAMALVVMRLDDAERRGETVLAVIDEPLPHDSGRGDGHPLEPSALAPRLGHAHAASGLLAIGAAVVTCAHGIPSPSASDERDGTRRLTVDVRALGGERDRVTLRSIGNDVPLPSDPPAPEGPLLVRSVHDPAPSLPPLSEQAMTPPYALASPASAKAPSTRELARPGIVHPQAPRQSPPRSAIGAAGAAMGVAEVLERHGQRMLERHQTHLAVQAEAFELYRAHQRAIWDAFVPRRSADGGDAPLPVPEPDVVPPHSPREPRGPSFDRNALAIHASGRISEIFGPLFRQQDQHAVQVRMPEQRLLLADRVTGIDAEPGVLGEGTVWTETDVTGDSWYLHAGRLPAGLMIEAGQADLFLISYMGIDFHNRGQRAYRLLGCDVTYRRSLPAIGETLRYDIHVDGHAKQDDVRLFFFHYDCRIGDEIVLSVRNGQAGFFSDEELAHSEGVIWDPRKQAIAEEARLDPPAVHVAQSDFGPAEIAAFAAGDLVRCFGAGFELTQSHTRTPTIQGGDMSFIDRIEGFDARGGPWGRGYLLARKTITPDLWFFDGHFKNDPCMPGTLMLEGCLQMMAFYIAALGYTVDRDGWRFEPVLDHSVNLRCRGQVLPDDEELLCEIFVEEVHDGPYPTVYADLLGTVNGLKAFHARRMGLRLVPDWPLSSRPDLPGGPGSSAPAERGPVAVVDGFRFDYASLLACAWGKPSRAFGPMYAPFDDVRRVPRLPGPPYHFMSRVEEVTGPIGTMAVGSSATIAYDVPPDAWYFADNGTPVMPFAVLLETVLQPCGWLASYVGSAITSDVDLSFRNLDGDGVVHVDVGPSTGTLTTRTTLTSVSQTAGMIIQSFDVTCHAGDTLVYELRTVFGFFPAEALQNQIGLPTDDTHRAASESTGEPEEIDGERWPQLAGGRLLMLDRLVAFEPDGGPAGLGRAVAEKTVDPSEWFFAAHFFQDPVQPGSLGLEAILQLLQLFMLKTGMHEGDQTMRFEPLRLGEVTRWKYRGQVVPHNRIITTDITITERGRDARGPYVVATASLWVDRKRIYEAAPIGMRLVSA